MGTVTKHVDDDLDLDALMVRVREAASAGAGDGAPARAHVDGDMHQANLDLVRVIDAQAEWNEQTRQSLAAMVECLRALREDWTDAHERLRHDMEQLSALISELRTGTVRAATRTKQAAGQTKRARGASVPARAPAKRRPGNGGRRRS